MTPLYLNKSREIVIDNSLKSQVIPKI